MHNERPVLFVDKEAAARIALAMYIGERCKFCDVEFKSLDDLHGAVCASKHPFRIAHEACYAAHQEPAL